MKKILAVILVVTMLLCSSIVSAGAFGFDFLYEIKNGETITVEIPDSKIFSYVMIQFIPEESGYYALTSSSDNEINDPYCELYYGEDASLLEYNDDYYGLDFCLKYELEAGKLYYFVVHNYNGAAQLEVTLGCGHNYVDGFCEYCSEECSHIPMSDKLGLCECGKVFAGTDIRAGDTVSYVYNEEDEYKNIFRFIPEEDGVYTFASSSDSEIADPYAELFDEELMWLGYSDDADGYDFSLSYEFEAGKVYYYPVYDSVTGAEAFEITLEKAVHETENGSIHELSYIYGVEETCTETGYEAGLYCEICDEYISGHEEIPMMSHRDFDADGYCEMCGGEVPLPDCSHLCHSESPVLSFIWKVINFFNKIFYKNPFCECGAYHFA